MSQEIDELADGFFHALEVGDLDAIRNYYAPDVEVWHNTDGRRLNRERAVKSLAGFVARAGPHHYENVRRKVWGGGFVQQHTLRVTLDDKAPILVEACVVAEVADGAIKRLDAYFDEGAMADILGRIVETD